MERKWVSAGDAKEAAALLSSQAVFLAGGTEINRLGSFVPPADLISLKKCGDLKGVEACEGGLRIGSMCTFQELIENEAVPAFLKEALAFMASRIKRNMATIGGNIAVARDDSYLLPALLASDASLELMDKGGSVRICSVWEYLKKQDKDALILAVIVPEDPAIAQKRYANTAESHAYLTIAVSQIDGEFIVAAAIKNCSVFRLEKLEDAINANPDITEEELIDWCRSCKEAEIKTDMFGGEDYKRYLLGVTISALLSKVKQ